MANAAANSLTLLDYGLMSNSPLVRKIIISWLKYNSIMVDIPMITRPTLIMNGSRFLAAGINALPVNYRKINEQPINWKAVPKPFQESAFVLNAEFDIDRLLTLDQNSIGNQFANQLDAWNQHVVKTTNNDIINNDPTVDVDRPVGWRYRLANPTLFDIPSEMLINAAGVDLTAGSNGLKFLVSLQQALDNMGAPDGDGVFMYADERAWRQIDWAVKAAGTTGGFRIDKDQYDRSVVKFKNATKRTTGRKSDDVTHILGSETTAGVINTAGTATATSMFLVKMDSETGFGGWQMQEMDDCIFGPVMLNSLVQNRMVVDYPWGHFQQGVRSISQIYGIAIGAGSGTGA